MSPRAARAKIPANVVHDAWKTDHKIYALLALVALVSGTLYCSLSGGQRDSAGRAVPRRPSTLLPAIALSPPVVEGITKIELTHPDWVDEQSRYHTITIEKSVDGWEITSPGKTRASTSKVRALLDNLKILTLAEPVELSPALYEQYRLADGKALHVVAWEGKEKVTDLYFGRSDERGQLVRIGETGDVFAMLNSGRRGYSGFLYTRSLRSWRETAILAFAGDDVVGVDVLNPNGRFMFTRIGRGWSGSLARRNRDGTFCVREPEWAAFDGSKVDDLVRAYQSLSADDFGDDDQRIASGVDEAEQTGGTIVIRLKGKSGDRTIHVGRVSTNTGRWAIKNSRWAIEEGGDGTLYVLAPWTADWATASASMFERTEERRAEGKDLR